MGDRIYECRTVGDLILLSNSVRARRLCINSNQVIHKFLSNHRTYVVILISFVRSQTEVTFFSLLCNRINRIILYFEHSIANQLAGEASLLFLLISHLPRLRFRIWKQMEHEVPKRNYICQSAAWRITESAHKPDNV